MTAYHINGSRTKLLYFDVVKLCFPQLKASTKNCKKKKQLCEHDFFFSLSLFLHCYYFYSLNFTFLKFL